MLTIHQSKKQKILSISEGEKLVSASICGYVAEAFIRNDNQVYVFSMKRSIKIFSSKQTQKKKEIAPFLLHIHTFSLNLQQFCTTAVDYAEGLLNKKVLLKLSSKVKLRNFDNGMKMIAVASHHLIYTYLYRSGYSHLVWAIALSIPLVVRRPDFRIRQI